MRRGCPILFVIVLCSLLLMSSVSSAAPVVLRIGDRGETVRVLQELLKAHGLFGCGPDGNFGPRTEEAVLMFQKEAGLTVDALVGPATWEALLARPYIVQENDTFDSLGQRFGVKAAVWQETNPHINPYALEAGLLLKIPFLPLRAPQQSSRSGERPASVQGQLINWSEVNRQFAPFGQARVTDVVTGLAFTVRRRGGSNHADIEPLTAADTKILQRLYPSWSWERRAVTVDYGHGPVAASINGYPHGGSEVCGNNFPGHICLHFLGSRTHGTGSVCPQHQAMVKRAAGQ